MSYDEKLAERIREVLSSEPEVSEQKMMGGLTFMIHDKMCVGILKKDLMCRLDPTLHEMVVQKPGCRIMDFTNRPMKGFVFVSEEATKSKEDLDYWVHLSLEYNNKAKPSKRKRKK